MEKRKYKLSKKSVLKNVGGAYVLFTTFADLTDDELVDQFKHFIAKQDYEYCEEIWQEAKARGINIKYKV